MSEIWIPAAGGGADLDVVTAQAGDVLQDKVIVGPDGEPLTGTMPNRGNYNGSGNSKGNDAGNQRMWVKVPKGYYNENAQVFLSWADIRQMAGIRPEVIKKNVSIIGITGTFEGYVIDDNDLYKGGNNPANFIVGPWSSSEYVVFKEDHIYYERKDYIGSNDNRADSVIYSKNRYDFLPYRFLNVDIEVIELAWVASDRKNVVSISLDALNTNYTYNRFLTMSSTNISPGQRKTISINLDQYNTKEIFALTLTNTDSKDACCPKAKIHHIWFSS